MKITRILSASVLAGAVLFSSTACSVFDMGDKKDPAAASSTASGPASSAPTESSQTKETTNTVSDEAAVAEVVNGYYTYVLLKGSLADIKKAAEPLDGKDTVTDDELNQLASRLPEGFQYFDISNPELIKNAYIQLLNGGTVGETMTGVEIVVPESAVTVEGDRATVNTTLASVTRDGKELNSTQDPYAADLLNLKKNDSGSWVMVAEAPKAKSSSSETPAPGDSASPEATDK